MKSSSVTVRYSPNADEEYAVSVCIPASFPDSVDEARAVAVKALREMVGDVLSAYGVEGDDD